MSKSFPNITGFKGTKVNVFKLTSYMFLPFFKLVNLKSAD